MSSKNDGNSSSNKSGEQSSSSAKTYASLKQSEERSSGPPVVDKDREWRKACRSVGMHYRGNKEDGSANNTKK